jgi:flagellar biosynthesis/type III secretory pathway protein FliH
VKTVAEAMLRLHPDDLAIFEQQIDRFDQLVQESGRQQGRARLRASAIDLDAIVRNAVARALKEAL